MKHSTHVIRKLIMELIDKLPSLQNNVVFTTSTDYSENGLDIARAKLPCLYLIGPDRMRNSWYTTQEKPTKQNGDGTFTRYTPEEAIDLRFEMILLTNQTMSLMDLIEEIEAFFMNGKKITALRCPDDESIGTVDYEIDIARQFVSGRMINRSNLRESSAEMIVRGVLLSDGQIFEEGFVATEINVNLSSQ